MYEHGGEKMKFKKAFILAETHIDSGRGFTLRKKAAFTLAETMIVIVVLGIIATLTIPALVNKQKESVAKTKVRKAMAAYESALNKMIIENDLKSDTALNEWAGAVQNCGNPSNYFKKVQGDGCIFKTSDGIWWNISDIERPLIAFKEDDLDQTKANAANDYSAFVLVGRFGNDGSLRVDDLAYETANSVDDANGYASKAQVEKLYTLLGMKSAQSGETEEQWEDCGDDCQKIDDWTFSNSCKSCKYTEQRQGNMYLDYEDEDGNINHYWNLTGYIKYYFDDNGNRIKEESYYNGKLRDVYSESPQTSKFNLNEDTYDINTHQRIGKGEKTIVAYGINYREDGSIYFMHGEIIDENGTSFGTVFFDKDGNVKEIEFEG